MNIKLIGSLLAVSLIACPLLYIFVGPALDAGQMDTLKVPFVPAVVVMQS